MRSGENNDVSMAPEFSRSGEPSTPAGMTAHSQPDLAVPEFLDLDVITDAFGMRFEQVRQSESWGGAVRLPSRI
jgi:hypothetical protein